MSQSTAMQDRKPSAGGVNTTFLWIEIKRMLRNRRTIVFTVLMPAIFFFIFGLSNKDQQLPNGHSYGQYILISLTVYAAMTAATGAGSQVAVERAQGWSRQLRLTPLLPGAYIAIKAAAALTLSLVAVIAQFVIGAIAGVTMDAQTWVHDSHLVGANPARADRVFAAEVARLVKAHDVRLPWFANVRVNVDRATLSHMADAGFRCCGISDTM